jgi:hypothetical protein
MYPVPAQAAAVATGTVTPKSSKKAKSSPLGLAASTASLATDETTDGEWTRVSKKAKTPAPSTLGAPSNGNGTGTSSLSTGSLSTADEESRTKKVKEKSCGPLIVVQFPRGLYMRDWYPKRGRRVSKSESFSFSPFLSFLLIHYNSMLDTSDHPTLSRVMHVVGPESQSNNSTQPRPRTVSTQSQPTAYDVGDHDNIPEDSAEHYGDHENDSGVLLLPKSTKSQ